MRQTKEIMKQKKEQRNELKLQTDFSSEQVIYDPFKERFFDIFYSTQ